MFGCDSWEGTTTIAYPLAGAVITTQPGTGGSAQKTTLESVTLQVASTTTAEYSPSSVSSPSGSSNPAAASSVPSGVNIAAAIGGALGGFASVVVAILAVYKFWSKKKKEPLNP